jgi:hypothetical protein
MNMKNLVEILSHDADGYRPLVDYESWRVALLNSAEELQPENIDYVQRHDFTDEVFVLLAGCCILFLYGDNPDGLGECEAVRLWPGILYNVKKGVWHTHALTPGSKVLVVENRDTTNDNSPIVPLDALERQELVRAAAFVFDHESVC